MAKYLTTAEAPVRPGGQARRTILAHERGYHVDDEGRLWSPYGTELSARPSHDGYIRFSFRETPRSPSRPVYAHQLAALQKFGAAALAEGTVVRHRDDNPVNNRPDNIEIGTVLDNNMDKAPAARASVARIAASSRRKLTDAQALKLRADHRAGRSAGVMADELGIAKSTASYIINGKTYR